MNAEQDPFTHALARELRIALDDAPHLKTRKDLSSASGIAPRTLKRYLDGEREIPVLVLRLLASALRANLGDLIDRAEGRVDD